MRANDELRNHHELLTVVFEANCQISHNNNMRRWRRRMNSFRQLFPTKKVFIFFEDFIYVPYFLRLSFAYIHRMMYAECIIKVAGRKNCMCFVHRRGKKPEGRKYFSQQRVMYILRILYLLIRFFDCKSGH